MIRDGHDRAAYVACVPFIPPLPPKKNDVPTQKPRAERSNRWLLLSAGLRRFAAARHMEVRVVSPHDFIGA